MSRAWLLPCLLVAGALLGRPAPAAESLPAAASATVNEGLGLADTLRGLGQHDACAVEALRHAFQTPAQAGAAVDLASYCLASAGRWQDARSLWWHPRHRHLLVDAGLRWHACVAASAMGAAALPELCGAQAPSPRAVDDPRLTLLPTVQALRAGRWTEAAETSRSLTAHPLRDEVQVWLNRASSLPSSSPWVAASLSAVVPGLGRVYLGRWQEGLTSLITVALPCWFAWRGFEADGVGSVRGWLLGSTAGIFYLGNVYGSWLGAEVDRRQAERKLQAEIGAALLPWMQP